MIAIIDYGSGNLRSVVNALRFLKQDVRICGESEVLARAGKIVLPGVGSSKSAMEGLARKGLIQPILEHIRKGTPFLGICLGMQLLFSRSLETGGCDCLDIVQGDVRLFPAGSGLKIPQIGWNTVKFQNSDCPIFRGIKDESYFYFVHSYYCKIEETAYAAGVTEYGFPYTSVLWKDNIFAVQFHPERSQENGLKMLKNFAEL